MSVRSIVSAAVRLESAETVVAAGQMWCAVSGVVEALFPVNLEVL